MFVATGGRRKKKNFFLIQDETLQLVPIPCCLLHVAYYEDSASTLFVATM